MGPYKEIILQGLKGFRVSIPMINKTLVNQISIYEESPELRTTLSLHRPSSNPPKKPDAALLPTAHEPPSSHTKL